MTSASSRSLPRPRFPPAALRGRRACPRSRVEVLQVTLRLGRALCLGVEDLLELLGEARPHARTLALRRPAVAPAVPRRLGRQNRFVVVFHAVPLSQTRATCYDPAAMELYGVRIPTI